MKQLGQDGATDSGENQIHVMLMFLLFDSLENKYNLLDKFASTNIFLFLFTEWLVYHDQYYKDRQNNKHF